MPDANCDEPARVAARAARALLRASGRRRQQNLHTRINFDHASWAPPAVTDAAALFMHIVNNGASHDRLIAASTPIAGTVIFRTHDGTPLEYYDLWPKRPVELGPGRRYIALRDLKGPLALDDTFPVTLRFATAGEIIVTAIVEAGPEDDTAGG